MKVKLIIICHFYALVFREAAIAALIQNNLLKMFNLQITTTSGTITNCIRFKEEKLLSILLFCKIKSKYKGFSKWNKYWAMNLINK